MDCTAAGFNVDPFESPDFGFEPVSRYMVDDPGPFPITDSFYPERDETLASITNVVKGSLTALALSAVAFGIGAAVLSTAMSATVVTVGLAAFAAVSVAAAVAAVALIVLIGAGIAYGIYTHKSEHIAPAGNKEFATQADFEDEDHP